MKEVRKIEFRMESWIENGDTENRKKVGNGTWKIKLETGLRGTEVEYGKGIGELRPETEMEIERWKKLGDGLIGTENGKFGGLTDGYGKRKNKGEKE